MAKQIEGVYEKVMECAKLEFLQKGFKDASLRTIANNADTSTGSIYTRFSDKDGLFNELVSPVVEGLKNWFWKDQEKFDHLPVNKKRNMFDYASNKIIEFMDYVYDHFDTFKLLISCSEGTAYEEFVHDIVEMDVKYTIKFIEATGNDALVSGRATTELLHIISSAYYNGVFETVIHNMSRETAYIYIKQLRQFFQCGWMDILYPSGKEDMS